MSVEIDICLRISPIEAASSSLEAATDCTLTEVSREAEETTSTREEVSRAALAMSRAVACSSCEAAVTLATTDCATMPNSAMAVVERFLAAQLGGAIGRQRRLQGDRVGHDGAEDLEAAGDGADLVRVRP